MYNNSNSIETNSIKKYLLSQEELNKAKKEFLKIEFRNYLDLNLPNKCCNCNSEHNLSYHHIVPLSLGGSNKLSNIVKLCPICHEKAHLDYTSLKDIGIFKAFRNNTIGRKKLIVLDNKTEDILKKYYNLEIGTIEAKTLLGISTKTKSTWYNIRQEYEEKYNISKGFSNKIDLQNSQKLRNETYKNSSTHFKYNNTIENILHEYFDCKIGAKEAKDKIGISSKSCDTWYRLINVYKDKFNIAKDFKNFVDIENIQKERILTTKQNILNKKINEIKN